VRLREAARLAAEERLHGGIGGAVAGGRHGARSVNQPLPGLVEGVRKVFVQVV
jgi:hypothetical protein